MIHDMSSGQVVIVSTATNSPDEAHRIADALVAQRLAACVQITPTESIYRWDGHVQHEAEQRLHIKTIASRLTQVEACIRAIHSYELPELLVLPVAGGAPAYLAWVKDSIADAT
jgi:periplasmic divalent cation tolerance protein